MLFTNAGVRPGDSVLVQGAGGGVATAAIVLGKAAGLRVFATSRDEAKRKRALELGAVEAVEPGARLPQRVDAVIETVGAATWSHSVKSLRPGHARHLRRHQWRPALHAELTRVFFLELKIVGSTMGTKDELEDLLSFCAATGVRVPSSTRCFRWTGPARASSGWPPGGSSARSCSAAPDAFSAPPTPRFVSTTVGANRGCQPMLTS
ncbi:zinc-binding dehydrogenase [Streptomyces thinghirensis]|nr:zinc-binding dehydrogenase [Streptomyces thinghirensis]